VAANPFEKFIRHYDRYHRGRIKDQENWFLRQPCLREAISCAALARWQDGKKFDHQWRLKNPDLRQAQNALLAVEREIARCATFDQLYHVVEEAVRQIWKNPELYCYDTALRIGAKLHLKPDKIYLHRGTRVGARRLGLKAKGTTLDISALPLGLQNLKASELEDILCLYKDEF
jgi:hypothetical protein